MMRRGIHPSVRPLRSICDTLECVEIARKKALLSNSAVGP